MTLAEAMAMAVIKGDMAAAYALADKLLEDRDTSQEMKEQAARELRRHHTQMTGYEVFRWDEFRAFFKRLGGNVELLHRNITIRLPVDGIVSIEQDIAATDTAPAGTVAIDTTTLWNREWRTYRPPPAPHVDLPDEGNLSS